MHRISRNVVADDVRKGASTIVRGNYCGNGDRRCRGNEQRIAIGPVISPFINETLEPSFFELRPSCRLVSKVALRGKW